jgi:hypothetical protein
MTLVNNLRQKLDQPVWEWCRFAPTATQALSALCSGDSLTERYMYYLSGTTFYRYDTVTDAWQLLASPNTATLTVQSMRYSSYGGYRFRAIAAPSSTTIQCAGIAPGNLNGKTLRIMSGTGAGQQATISTVSAATIADHGVVTSAASTSIGDTTKHWSINQWVGYQVRIVFDTGVSQVRKVIYNDTQNLYFSDANYQAIDPWSNTGFAATAPFALPINTAGSQSHYAIESHIMTISTPWTVNPDYTSRFVVLSGAVWLVSSSATAPFFTHQVYDVASDTWYNRTAAPNLILAALGTDFSIERTGEDGGVFASGTASSSTAQSLVTTNAWTDDRYANYQVRITGGTGVGQRRRITSNTPTTLFVDSVWKTNPDSTSTYSIYGNTDTVYMMGNSSSATYQYSVENDIWAQGSIFSDGTGIASQLSAQMNGWAPVGITSITRNTGGIITINPTPVAAGTGYVLGEIITLATGTLGKVIVTGVTTSGAITSVALLGCGLTYTVATFAQASTTGAGTGATFAVTAIGTVGRVVTAINHFFQIGNSVTLGGATDATYNVASTILGSDSLTGFDIATTAAATAVVASTPTTSLIVDPTQNWATNEHAGRLVQVIGAGYNSTTGQVKRITSNTATTLTLVSALGTAPVNGTTRYVIHEVNAFGRDEQWRVPTRNGRGKATGGSTTTLIDTTKNWLGNQWLNYKFRVMAGTGVGSEITITANTATTLTFTAQSFTPDATTKYLIMDTFGLATAAGTVTTLTDTTKNWGVNQWAGKRIKLISGTGQGQEATIASNTATVLTFGAVTTAPGTDTNYVIYAVTPRSTGLQAQWAFGTSDTTLSGKYIWIAQGGGATRFDRLDVTTELWDFGLMFAPQTELLNTGAMYTYDGQDRIYFTIAGVTCRVFCLNLPTLTVDACGTHPYSDNAATIGNRMEIIKTSDGLPILYVMRQTAQEMWRMLIFW